MRGPTILLLEDEPLVLMDLEMAAQDRQCRAIATSTPDAAMRELADAELKVDVAILDVSLGGGKTCEAVAKELQRRSVPYLLYTGNLDRHDELVRGLGAPLCPKPARSDDVVNRALSLLEGEKAREA